MRANRAMLIFLLILWPRPTFAAPALPITLAARMERPLCPEGQPVVLALALHNGGEQRLTIGGGAFEESSFQITVKDGAGREIPRTAVGERVLTPPMMVFANPTIVLDPGKTLRYRFNLARLFDLSRAGLYTVSVSRRGHGIPPPSLAVSLQESALTAGPLSVRMVEASASYSGPTPFTPLSSHQTFLYMVGRYDAGVTTYRIEESGRVSPKFDPTSVAPAPIVTKGAGQIETTLDGRFLYVSNGVDNTVTRFRIGDDGVLWPLSPLTIPAQKSSSPQLINLKGRFLFGPFLYVSNGVTYGYRLLPNGEVTALPAPGASASGLSGGRDNAVAQSPSGRFAFIGVSTSDGSSGFDLVVPMRVAQDGSLSPLPGAQTPQSPPLPWPRYQPPPCSTLAVDPTGQFLVVVNPNYLDCFRIGPEGSLTPLGMTMQRGDLTSVFFGAKSHLVYALNRNPNTLVAFRLDSRRGLTPSGLDPLNDVAFDASTALAVAPTPEHWGPMKGGLAVSAHLSADVLPAARPVVLRVVLKNVTSHPIRLGTAGADMASFRLSIIGPMRQSPGALTGAGEPAAVIPLSAAGHDLLNTPGPDRTAVVLPPGGQHQYRLILSRLADLTVAGNYTIQVSRVLPSGATVASLTLHILLEGPFNGLTRGEQELDVF